MTSVKIPKESQEATAAEHAARTMESAAANAMQSAQAANQIGGEMMKCGQELFQLNLEWIQALASCANPGDAFKVNAEYAKKSMEMQTAEWRRLVAVATEGLPRFQPPSV